MLDRSIEEVNEALQFRGFRQQDMLAKHYLIRGRVQGVGYRYFALGAAERLGVKGFVRNLHHGEVEIHAEADKVRLELFKLELARGPRMAEVTEVIESDRPVSGVYSSFTVRG
jgi:acylphosphatase